MHDVVRRQGYHPLMGFMPRLPALGRAGRGIAKKTLGTVAVRLAAAAVLTLVSVAPAWAAGGSVTGLTAPPAVSQARCPTISMWWARWHPWPGRLRRRRSDPEAGRAGHRRAPPPAGAPAAEPDGPEESASELNRKLTNPVSSLWSISNQFNNFKLENGHWNNNWNFQPVLPVSLTKDVNLITRPVMPFYNIVPHGRPRPVRAHRWAGRPGPAGAALARALGSLGPRRRTDLHLSHRDLDVHRPGQGAGRTRCGGRLPHAGNSSSACSPSSGSPSAATPIGRTRANSISSPSQRSSSAGLERRILWQYPGELEGIVRGRLDGAHRPRRGQGREAGAAARQIPALAAIHARASPGRPGVERAGPDRAGHPEAHQGAPVRVTGWQRGGETKAISKETDILLDSPAGGDMALAHLPQRGRAGSALCIPRSGLSRQVGGGTKPHIPLCRRHFQVMHLWHGTGQSERRERCTRRSSLWR